MRHRRSGPGALAGAAEAKPNVIVRRSFTPRGTPEQQHGYGVSRRARSRDDKQGRPVDFAQVNCAALAILPRLLERWLPGGRIEGIEYVVRNPKRRDRRAGSFKVNLVTCRWADFATGDKG